MANLKIIVAAYTTGSSDLSHLEYLAQEDRLSLQKLLWIYWYIPLFLFIIYSLNYFPDIFSIYLFKTH